MRKSEVEHSSANSSLNCEVGYETSKSGLAIKQVNKLENAIEDPFLFWKQELDITSPFLDLPVDFPRSSATSNRINHVFFSLSDSCLDALKQLNDQLDVNLFTILLATYNTLLFRYTKQEDIIIGFPSYENNLDKTGELDSLLNTKLFRTNLSGNPSFNELLKRVHQTVLTADKHKGVSYETLEKAMKLELGVNYTGLYNVIFSYRNIGVENNEINDPTIIIPEDYITNIDLWLSVKETNQGLKGVWTYNSELFEAATIKRIAKHFEVLLEAITVNPQQAISRLHLLTDKEHHQLTLEWNSSQIDFPSNKCIHELFEAQVIKTPDAIALVFENAELTYRELNERSNQLAHYLCSRDVKQETLIPICIDRSLEMVIGILGILKAGGAYVPIDPNCPLERIAYLLEDTKASLVVCNKESKTKLKAFLNIYFLELNSEASFLKKQPADNLNINISWEQLAYVIYTSGSTGKPKGVMIEHRNLVNYISYSKAKYINDEEVKAGSFIHLSYTFDASLTGLFAPLLSGKFLVIGSKNQVDIFTDSNLEKYAPYDFIKITPSHLGLLPTIFKSIDGRWLTGKLVIGGEALRLNQFDSFIKEGIEVEIINEYGPTETTVGCSIYSFYTLGNHKFIRNDVPIGKPISNAKIYILNGDKELTPIGVTGEICIGGSGLARGYLNRPELTAEKFIKDPFGNNPNARLYKTGDLGRWLPDGNIEYLGRMDDQVKIRGYRIELGEIENVLTGSGLVQQGVVLAKEDTSGNKRLVGYVIPQGSFDKQVLQNYLSTKLPEYMVPALWVKLERLPLTPNGKTDRKSLPDPQLTDMVADYVAPHNAVEDALAGIWRDLLGVERVGANDNFFELGGNSIQAVALFAKIKKKFHKSLPLTTIVNAPTIYKLAVAVKATTEALSSSLVPIQPNGFKTPLFAIHAGGGGILFYESLSLCLGINQPFYALQAKGINGTELPSTQMEEMASYYIDEIRKVQPEGPYYLAGYCLGARIIFEMAQQLTRDGQKIALLANFNGISSTYYNRPASTIGTTTETFQRKFSKTSAHFNNIAKLSLKKKALYISTKLNRKVQHKVQKLYFLSRFKLFGLVFKSCLLFKQKVPGAIARRYVGNTLGILQNNYKPKPYPGSMIIFRSPGIYKEPYLGWKGLVKGEIKSFDIPGLHESRRDIMNEPYVQFLAKELKNFLGN